VIKKTSHMKQVHVLLTNNST